MASSEYRGKIIQTHGPVPETIGHVGEDGYVREAPWKPIAKSDSGRLLYVDDNGNICDGRHTGFNPDPPPTVNSKSIK